MPFFYVIIIIGDSMKRGFTLVELLAVLILLGVVSLIAIPSIGKILNRSREKARESTKNELIKAAKNYYADINIYCKDEVLNCILDNIDKISINAINLPFLNYCLKFYLQKGISLMFKDTCDKLIINIENLIEDTNIRNQGIFTIPLLESDLVE